MTSVKPDDLLRFVEGEIQDAEELDRIEAAIDNDPPLAAEFDQLDAAFDPAPDVAERIRGMFQALEASVWARLQFSTECAPAEEPQQVRLTLPGGQAVSVTLRTTPEGVHLRMSPRPRGWRAASIALFHPRVAGGGPLELCGGVEASVAPQPAARSEAADAWRVREHESAFSLSAEHRDDSWISDTATNSLGGRAWLEDSAEGLALVVDLPESAGSIETARYKLDWQGTEGSKPARPLPLTLNEGRRIGQVPLGLAAGDVRNSPHWRLRVEPVGDEEQPHLDASRFRSLVGDDFQTLILTAEPGQSQRQPVELSAAFQNDRQRAMWDERLAACWVRFERA